MFASLGVGIQWDAGPGVGTAGWTLLSPLTSLLSPLSGHLTITVVSYNQT